MGFCSVFLLTKQTVRERKSCYVYLLQRKRNEEERAEVDLYEKEDGQGLVGLGFV
jgi:hypothetical protein